MWVFLLNQNTERIWERHTWKFSRLRLILFFHRHYSWALKARIYRIITAGNNLRHFAISTFLYHVISQNLIWRTSWSNFNSRVLMAKKLLLKQYSLQLADYSSCLQVSYCDNPWVSESDENIFLYRIYHILKSFRQLSTKWAAIKKREWGSLNVNTHGRYKSI